MKKLILLFLLVTLFSCSEIHYALDNVNRGLGIVLWGNCSFNGCYMYGYHTHNSRYGSQNYFVHQRSCNRRYCSSGCGYRSYYRRFNDRPLYNDNYARSIAYRSPTGPWNTYQYPVNTFQHILVRGVDNRDYCSIKCNDNRYQHNYEPYRDTRTRDNQNIDIWCQRTQRKHKKYIFIDNTWYDWCSYYRH